MPVVGPQPSGNPYPTVGDVLQAARVEVNDAAGPGGLSGDLLSSSNPSTLVMLNLAWERVQEQLADAGVETLTKEVIISNLSALTTPDPSTTTYLTWNGYFDGTQLNDSSMGAPALPQDLILPLRLWERPNGSGTVFTNVDPVDGGLPEGFQGASLRYYEWRSDKLYFKGATNAVDLKVRYVAWLPALAIDDTTEIPIMRTKRAMAYLIASDYCNSRGAGEQADKLYARADTEIKLIANRTARRKASIPYRRSAYGY